VIEACYFASEARHRACPIRESFVRHNCSERSATPFAEPT
jgi:hypothetical protein